MATAQEYLGYLHQSQLVPFSYTITSVVEARAAIGEIRVKQQTLRLAKKNIGADMKMIRSDFQKRVLSAGSEVLLS